MSEETFDTPIEPLERWVQRLDEEEMPVFAATAKMMSALSRDEEVLLAELSKLVLQDIGMTSAVLKRANSAWHYMKRGGRINTVSRAVVVLGSQTVINICLTHLLVESIKDSRHRERAAREMARSFHAAVQAKGFSDRVRDSDPEELFIAALLHRLGHIAFWSFAEGEAEDLQALVAAGTDPVAAERQALGFRLDELTARLCAEWHLSPLLEDALAGRIDQRVRTVILCQRLASAATAGWDAPPVEETLGQLANHLRLDPESARRLALDNAEEASLAAQLLDAQFAGRLIPSPEGRHDHASAATAEAQAAQRSHGLELLGELTRVIAGGEGDLSQLLSIAVEGIFRGVAMQRVLFAMLTPDRTRLALRYGLGKGLPPVGTALCRIDPRAPNLFAQLLDQRQELWLDEEGETTYGELIDDEIRALTGGHPCFIMPTVVNGKPIGLFYADRGDDGPLDQEAFQLFWQFCQQVNLGIQMLSLKR